MYLYSNRSWATTNHSARSIHIIVKICVNISSAFNNLVPKANGKRLNFTGWGLEWILHCWQHTINFFRKSDRILQRNKQDLNRLENHEPHSQVSAETRLRIHHPWAQSRLSNTKIWNGKLILKPRRWGSKWINQIAQYFGLKTNLLTQLVISSHRRAFE